MPNPPASAQDHDRSVFEDKAKVLVIQTAFVGDLLLGIPLLKELRKLKPDSAITLLCRKGLGSFMIQAGLVDRIIEVDKTDSRTWKIAYQALKKQVFELIVCPHESVRSRLLVLRLRAAKKIGYRGRLNFLFFTDQVERLKSHPEAIRQLALLEPLDSVWKTRITPGSDFTRVPSWAEMSIPKLRTLRQQVHNSRAEKKTVFLAPGSVWATKMWTLEGFVKTAQAFLAAGHKVIIFGAPNEREICAELARRAPGAVSVAGQTQLYQSAELLCTGDLIICNDSGAMHMAAAVGLPSVAVFGPTILDFGYRPWQQSARVVQVDLKCRPCGTHGGRECPLGTHDCMKLVRAEAVLKQANELLALPGN